MGIDDDRFGLTSNPDILCHAEREGLRDRETGERGER
jgi:hypothetical protein